MKERSLSKPWTVLLAFLLVFSAAWPADADEQDATSERERIRQQQVELATKVDTLRADQSEAIAALDILNRNVAAQRSRAEDASRSLGSARAQLADAETRMRQSDIELANLRAQLVDFALSSYIRPPNLQLAETMLGADVLEAPKREVLTKLGLRDTAALLDRIRALREDRERAAREAKVAGIEAQRLEGAEAERLSAVQAAQGDQAELASKLEERLDRTLAESAQLAGRDQTLAAEIAASQAELARKLAASKPTSSSSGGGGGGGGGGGAKVVIPTSGSLHIVSVRGIEVNVDIADNLLALLAAADRDGVTLDGSGYRDIETQIYLRRQHCGTSDYAIYEMPSSGCSPPVARPGYSMHERGLAIDFIIGGDLIRSRATSAYGWLVANANRFGFYNLPSEPWHWSTTGS